MLPQRPKMAPRLSDDPKMTPGRNQMVHGPDTRVLRNRQFLKDIPCEMLTFGRAQDRPKRIVTLPNGPRQGLQVKEGPHWPQDGQRSAKMTSR